MFDAMPLSTDMPRLRQFLTLVDELLTLSAPTVLSSFLTYEQRLDLFSDVLLCHPSIRGKARPRDYPMTRARQASLELAGLLATTNGVLEPVVAAPLRVLRGWTSPDGRQRLGAMMAWRRRAAATPIYRLFDFIVAVRVCYFVEHGLHRSSSDCDDPIAGHVLGRLLAIVITDIAEADRAGAGCLPEAANTAAQYAFRWCVRALGFTLAEGQMFISAGRSSRNARRLMQRARFMALMTARSATLASSPDGAVFRSSPLIAKPERLAASLATAIDDAIGPAHRPTGSGAGRTREGVDLLMQELAGGKFALITFRTRHIQQFLRRARSTFIQRGASAWCSQTVARLRNHFATHGVAGVPLPILVDSDALFVMAAPPGQSFEAMRDETERFLAGWAQGGGLHDAYPRLATALLGAAALGESPRILNPDVEFELVPLSLLDYAIDCTSRSEADADVRAGRSRVIRSMPPVALEAIHFGTTEAEDGCDGVWNARAFPAPEQPGDVELRIPPWLSRKRLRKKDRKNRRGNRGDNEKYGISAWCYALAGTAWRAMTSDGVLRSVNRARAAGECTLEPDRYFGITPYREPRLRAWSSPTEMYVRIDGNDVGDIFVGTPRGRAPSLSPCLESDIGRRWLGALLRTLSTSMSCHDDAAELEPQCVVLPLHLVYFGGDDLQFQIASSVWPAFWQALVEQPSEPEPAELARVAYKVAAVEVPRGHDDDPGGFLFANACSPLLQELAKSSPNGERDVPASDIIDTAMQSVPASKPVRRSIQENYDTIHVTSGPRFQLAELRLLRNRTR